MNYKDMSLIILILVRNHTAAVLPIFISELALFNSDRESDIMLSVKRTCEIEVGETYMRQL